MRSITQALVVCVCASTVIAGSVQAGDRAELMARKERAAQQAQEARLDAPLAEVAAAAAPCVGGMAAGFPCEQIDLLSQLTLVDFDGASNGNDIWGWTDPQTGVEYALMGLDTGTAFVDISDPVNPVFVGMLPTHSVNSLWRDMKVYADYVFVVSEAGSHGMQVFDLNALRAAVITPVTFAETAHYSGIGGSHNIAINQDTGFAYIVGSAECAGGLHMVDISTPTNPTFAGCFDADGYSHDVQCVTYAGPDPDYQGHEICFGSNEDTITIIDVTDKANPVQLSRFTYPNVAYVHQGWLTDDHVYFVQDDELDELFLGLDTTTRFWDVTDLDAPTFAYEHVAATPVIDHNQYTRGHLDYQANYRGGLRVLDMTSVATGNVTEVGFFDTHPPDDATNFGAGAWSVYPYFASGVVVIGNYEGLLVVRPTFNQAPLCVTGGPYTGIVGAPVQLDGGGSSDPDDGIASFEWDFGDGSGTVAGASVAHTYGAVGEYIARLQVTDLSGAVSRGATVVKISLTTAVETAELVSPRRSFLHQNEPNPFNPTTRITFQLERASRVVLRIYDTRGAEVRTLVDATLGAGAHPFEWDGRDAAGREVASGAYFCQLDTGAGLLTRKMMLLK